MKRLYVLMILLSSFTISFSQTNLISLTEGTIPLGYFGRGLTTTGAWNQTPDILALTYYGRDFAVGGWSKSTNTWMGAALYVNSDNGNVGIGTTNPVSKLEVNVVGSTFTNNIRFGDATSAYLASGTSGIYISNNIGNPVFMVQHTGNVGIGTTTPTEKLAVNGNIRAREIKVENANWPDYVFTKDYTLPSLQQTEQHIKEKGHLPDIPSAEEVKANGIDVGEMNAKLLQKIEELTLYLIQIKKESDARNDKQTKEIEYLKSRLK